MDEIKQRALSNDNSINLLYKIKNEPNYCECARIGSRALNDGSMPIMRYLTNITGYFDRHNLQLEHQHILFSESKDNIGLMGHDGIPELFEENQNSQTYHYQSDECLDGSIMRKAINAIGIPKAYAWLGYNCQAYTQEIKEKYNQILDNLQQRMCSGLR